MNSVTLLGIELILCLTTAILLYKKYQTEGLYTYTVIVFILSIFMSFKTITVYNFDVNLGVVPFVTIFTASNILIQKKGPDATKNLILTLVASSIISYVILYLVSLMNSSTINLFTNASYDNIFDNSVRLYFAGLVTMLYSLLLNSKLYYYLKRMKNNILISNLFSTIIIQFISAILFGLIAYFFEKDTIDIIKIIMVRYLISLIVGICGTIIIYISKYIKEKKI